MLSISVWWEISASASTPTQLLQVLLHWWYFYHCICKVGRRRLKDNNVCRHCFPPKLRDAELLYSHFIETRYVEGSFQEPSELSVIFFPLAHGIIRWLDDNHVIDLRRGSGSEYSQSRKKNRQHDWHTPTCMNRFSRLYSTPLIRCYHTGSTSDLDQIAWIMDIVTNFDTFILCPDPPETSLLRGFRTYPAYRVKHRWCSWNRLHAKRTQHAGRPSWKYPTWCRLTPDRFAQVESSQLYYWRDYEFDCKMQCRLIIIWITTGNRCTFPVRILIGIGGKPHSDTSHLWNTWISTLLDLGVLQALSRCKGFLLHEMSNYGCIEAPRPT